MIENEILTILRQRFEDCVLYEAPDHLEKCKGVLATYDKAVENWFTKCKLCVMFRISFVYSFLIVRISANNGSVIVLKVSHLFVFGWYQLHGGTE